MSIPTAQYIADLERTAREAQEAMVQAEAERERLREALSWIAERKLPSEHEGTGYAATLRQVVLRARRALGEPDA